MKRKLIESIGQSLDDTKTLEVFELINKYTINKKNSAGINNAGIERLTNVGVRGTAFYHVKKLVNSNFVKRTNYVVDETGVRYHLYTTTKWGRDVMKQIEKIADKYTNEKAR